MERGGAGSQHAARQLRIPMSSSSKKKMLLPLLVFCWFFSTLTKLFQITTQSFCQPPGREHEDCCCSLNPMVLPRDVNIACSDYVGPEVPESNPLSSGHATTHCVRSLGEFGQNGQVAFGRRWGSTSPASIHDQFSHHLTHPPPTKKNNGNSQQWLNGREKKLQQGRY